MPRRWYDQSPWSIDSWIRVGLVVAAFAPFVGTLFYGYVYDDKAIILHNPVIDGWRSLVEVWKHPYWSQGASGLYRPLLMTLFAVIWNGAHKFAIAFHLVAVGAHAIATLLVAKLLRRGVGRWPAALGALWFALSPVHVEAVANISNMSEVLVCIWTVLLALVLLPPDAASGESTAAPGWDRAALAAALYAAALLSKESGAVAPGLALLAVFAWKRSPTPISIRAMFARGWLRVIALWVVVLGIVIVVRSVVLQGVVGATSLAVPGLAGLTTGQRMIAALSLSGRIAQLLIWPTTQSPDYGPSALADQSTRVLVATIAITAILAMLGVCCWLASRTQRPDARPLAAVGWCLLGFLPASNLLAATGAVLAERTLYVSSAGVAMIVAWCLDMLLEASAARRTRPVIPRQIVPIAAGAALTVACVRGYIETREYAAVWRTNAALVAQMVRADSLNYRGYQLLAMDAREHHRYAESAALYARAYALVPFDPGVSLDYGEFLLETSRPRYALAMGERVLRHPDMWTNAHAVTLLLNATARVWGVDSVLAAAERLNARRPSARAALFVGMAYEARGDTSAANAAYRAGLRLSPGDSALSARALHGSTHHE
jgi:hypothetical protein